MNGIHIGVPKEKLEEFCRKHHIATLSFFGSVLRNDFTPESDIDVLVQFERGHAPGLIRFSGMEIELSNILGRKVDMNTPRSISGYFRDKVMREAMVQYAAS